MSAGDSGRLPAEARARNLIDQQLTAAGWVVLDRKNLNFFAAQGVAVSEMAMKPGHGRVDYLLYVDKAVVGVFEAKPVGSPLSGVEWQSANYAEGLPADVRLAARTTEGRLPFVFEASGVETHFPNGFDPNPRARHVSSSRARKPWRESKVRPENRVPVPADPRAVQRVPGSAGIGVFGLEPAEHSRECRRRPGPSARTDATAATGSFPRPPTRSRYAGSGPPARRSGPVLPLEGRSQPP